MQKTSYKASDILLCTCSNHLLLAPGSICELCMGLVAELDADELLPSSDAIRYDLNYFEELERYFEDIEYAA